MHTDRRSGLRSQGWYTHHLAVPYPPGYTLPPGYIRPHPAIPYHLCTLSHWVYPTPWVQTTFL